MLFINVTCGIVVIAVAAQLGVSKVHMTLASAAVLVIFMSLFNGIGRFSWAFISDYLSRPITYILFFIIQLVAFYVIANTTLIWLFELMVFLILSCYGGGFSLVPAFIADIFGVKEPGAIHGYILTAWAAAGLVGPMLIAKIKDHVGSFVGALYIFSVFLLIGLIIATVMMINIAQIKRKQADDKEAMIAS